MTKSNVETFYDEYTKVYNPSKTDRHFLEDDRYGNLARAVIAGGPNQLVLDAGCGNGWIASHYLEGNFVVGLDISDINLDSAATQGLRPLKADLDRTLPFADGAFDTIVCTEVLEHVFQPERILNEFLRILSPEGRLIITVPNLHALRNRWAMLIGRWTPFIEFGVYENASDPLSHVGVQHIRHYTRSGMFEILRQLNFQPEVHMGQSFHMNFSWPFRLLALCYGGNTCLKWCLERLGKEPGPHPGPRVNLAVSKWLSRVFPTLAGGMLVIARKRPPELS